MKIGERLYSKRLRQTSRKKEVDIDEYFSDRSRITFSSSFRRMMQKAQVFSLENNPSIRNRLTHTIEVADVGNTIARTICRNLIEKRKISIKTVEEVVTIVECACLIHDIGNPPFGHFGEEAIKKWFKDNSKEIIKKLKLKERKSDKYSIDDFYRFDGNPQGFRIVTKLHTERDQFGLNLTYSTLLASLKYPNYPKMDSPIFNKKLGIFSTEKDVYNQILKETGHPSKRRYFLSYLMELADDICFCMSDISDSFEKNIITSTDFIRQFNDICIEEKINIKEIIEKDNIENFNLDVSIPLSWKIMNEASRIYTDRINDFLDGEHGEIIEITIGGKYLNILKKFARKYIYTTPEAQRIEIAGYTIVYELLNHFSHLLEITREQFLYFIENDEMQKGSGLDIHWRIFKLISPRMIKAYKYSYENDICDMDEWLLRSHLIVDFISGMTDLNAKDVYQNVKGISL